MFPFYYLFFFFSSRRRHTRLQGDWSSDVCSSDLVADVLVIVREARGGGWNRPSALGRGQLPVHLGRFRIPVRLVGRAARFQRRFLRIESVLDERAFGTVNGKRRPR